MGDVELNKRNKSRDSNPDISCKSLVALFDGSIEKCETEIAKLEALAKVLEEKDPYTQAHSSRVMTIAEVIADEMGIDEDDLGKISQAAALHDVGKIGVPDEILTKPSKLTEEEIAIVRQHPQIAAQMLSRLLYPTDCVRLVYHHHEWFNGEGYPERNAGEEIPLGSRVIAVADAFDAMTSDRPYREAISPEEAERELLGCSGSQFDPEVVRALTKAKRKGRLLAS